MLTTPEAWKYPDDAPARPSRPCASGRLVLFPWIACMEKFNSTTFPKASARGDSKYQIPFWGMWNVECINGELSALVRMYALFTSIDRTRIGNEDAS